MAARTYDEIDPGMHPNDLAECFDDLAREYHEGAGECECKHNEEASRVCLKVQAVLEWAADKLRRIKA